MSEITYVYKTNNTNYEEIFEDGICFFNGEFEFNSSFDRVYDLYDYLNKLEDDEAAYIIKIPEKYLESQLTGSRRILPYPVLFEREAVNPNGKECDVYPVLIPSLIQMMYSGNIGCIQNENYNVNYNPCGLKFSKEQLENIKKKINSEYERFTDRNTLGDAKELYSKDMASGIWNSLMDFHGVKNPVNPFTKKGETGSIKFRQKKTKKLKNNNKKKSRRDD